MRYLLDTHTVLWMRENDPRLNRTKWEPVFFSSDNEIIVRMARLWEMTIKRSLRKLKFEGSLEAFATVPGPVSQSAAVAAEHTHIIASKNFFFDAVTSASTPSAGPNTITNNSRQLLPMS